MAEDVKECPACGEENEPIGSLGRLDHYTCRACGLWYYRDTAGVEKCPDCGEPGEMRGHMGCQYPGEDTPELPELGSYGEGEA